MMNKQRGIAKLICCYMNINNNKATSTEAIFDMKAGSSPGPNLGYTFKNVLANYEGRLFGHV
jgi:hypothetical protein